MDADQREQDGAGDAASAARSVVAPLVALGRHAWPKVRRDPIVLTTMGVIALALVVALGLLPSSGPGGPRAVWAATNAPDRVQVQGSPGVVTGTLAPGAPFTAEVTRAGASKSKVTGQADGSGFYTAALSYNSGNSWGIHNGDVVTVTDAATGARYVQRMQLVGMLEEDTGMLSGTALPGALLDIKVFADANHKRFVGERKVTVGSAGTFSEALAELEQPARIGSAPAAWRGYVADVTSRDVAQQFTFREFQTPNTTLVSTWNLTGGGFFLPGDTVTFELSRGGGRRATSTATVDGDGIPVGPPTADVGPGDVLRTLYHDSAGHIVTQQLVPWKLTAEVDLSSGTISGTTDPSVAVVVQYYADAGEQMFHASADRSGQYRLTIPGMVGGRGLVVYRVADPTGTGVGVQQIDFQVPQIRVDLTRGDVSGRGAPGVNPFRIEVLRGGTVVATATGTTSKAGGFDGRVASGVRTGDLVRVTTGTQALPVFSVGSPALYVWRPNAIAGLFLGKGVAGRTITVAGKTCSATGPVSGDGSWHAAATCTIGATEPVMIYETVISGPLAGSFRSLAEVLPQSPSSVP